MVRVGRQALINFCLVLVIVTIGWLMTAESAQATVCTQRDHQKVCLVSVQRSAKNYWEYWVRLTVNGQQQGLIIYNCQIGRKLQQASGWIDLTPDAIDQTVCSLYRN